MGVWRSNILSYLALSVTAAFLHLCVPASAAEHTTLLTADSPAWAIDELVGRYGYVITFEGPRDIYADSALVPRSAGGASPNTPVVEAVPITLRVPASSFIGPEEMARILRRLLAQANVRQADGHYRLQQAGSTFHIIPVQSRGPDGRWIPAVSVLDVPITIPVGVRSTLEMVDAICGLVGANAQIPMTLLQGPFGMLESHRSVLGATNEPARSVLERTLTGMSRRLTWRVFHDARMNAYFLLLLPVRDLPRTSTSSRE